MAGVLIKKCEHRVRHGEEMMRTPRNAVSLFLEAKEWLSLPGTGGMVGSGISSVLSERECGPCVVQSCEMPVSIV